MLLKFWKETFYKDKVKGWASIPKPGIVNADLVRDSILLVAKLFLLELWGLLKSM